MTRKLRLYKVVCLLGFWCVVLTVGGAEESLEVLLKSSLVPVRGHPTISGPATGHAETAIETTGDDQAYVKLPDGTEIRMKERSRVVFPAPGRVRVERGLAGFRLGLGSSPLTIGLSPAEFRLTDGIAVCKAYPGFFRIAVIKGKLDLRLVDGQVKRLLAPEEVAGCVREISQSYHPLDDLYFAWYWNAPAH